MNYEITCNDCGATAMLYDSTGMGWVAWPLYGTWKRWLYDALRINTTTLCYDCAKKRSR